MEQLYREKRKFCLFRSHLRLPIAALRGGVPASVFPKAVRQSDRGFLPPHAMAVFRSSASGSDNSKGKATMSRLAPQLSRTSFPVDRSAWGNIPTRDPARECLPDGSEARRLRGNNWKEISWLVTVLAKSNSGVRLVGSPSRFRPWPIVGARGEAAETAKT